MDPPGDQASVRFELLLTRAAQSDTAFLPLQVRPAPHQTRGQVTQLRELHLELALVRACTLGEDVEDELCAIHYAAAAGLLQVTHLSGGQTMIEQDHIGLVTAHRLGDLCELTRAHESGRIRAVPRGRDPCHRPRAAGDHQVPKFLGVAVGGSLAQRHLDEDGAIAAFETLEQAHSILLRPAGRPGREGSILVAWITTRVRNLDVA